ncbi:MAG: AAA family ATPase, partial [Nannocystaceae bacterium]
MSLSEIKQRISNRPGRASLGPKGLEIQPAHVDLAAKLRKAYSWLTNEALVCPLADIEFGERVTLGSAESDVSCRRGAAFSSYALLPLLNLVTGQRLLFVGAPGRGKTTVATLMGLLTGDSLEQVRRATQHGHPQLTIADLLGSPLPSSLIEAREASAIRVTWRSWLTRRVKIIDEYNRIPTKTQSALLSLMAEGYAEQFEQVVESGPSAWFLTANDDLGGGTFEVIAALKDRIDIVVRAVPYSSHEIAGLAQRVVARRSPEDVVPREVIFTPDELNSIGQRIREVPVEESAVEALGLLSSQLDFCRQASSQLEYMSKDTVHLAGKQLAHVCNEDCPLDKHENICSQTEHGISARTLLSTLLFAKALA